MPRLLKIRAASTDAEAMSETALTPPNEMTPPAAPEHPRLDAAAPRLGSAPMSPPAPMGGAGTPVATDPAAVTLPVVSPVLSDPGASMHSGNAEAAPSVPTLAPTQAAPALPTLAPTQTAPTETASTQSAPSVPSLPTLPTAAPAADTSEAAEKAPAAQGDGEHPMAHLMGGTSAPSEASRRAAELRAAKKAKAKKMKIGFAVGAVVVSAVAGPPLWSWFTDALDEAGDTSYEEPAD